MDVDAAGSGDKLPGEDQTSEAPAASLELREAALRERENKVWQRENALRMTELTMSELQSHNKDLRQLNEKLVMATLTAQELRERAQLARRRQDEFLAMLAHELRNPLAPISAAVEVLAKLDGKPVPGALLDVVRRQIKHLVRLVDDLLDVSRVTEGKVVLQRRATAVAEFVQHAVDICQHEIEARHQQLSVDIQSDPLFVDGDPVRLTQIVTNLLQNAAKYTPDGGAISVAARRQGTFVEIRVSDNGNGISAEALPHIFDLFVQDDRPLSRPQGGLGIGLTIVRRMAEMHGGTVEARSEGRGRGSEFVVKLPAIEPEVKRKLATQTVVALAPIPARVLIVEDNADAADTLAALLRLSGHEVETALDGPSGIDRFERMRPQIVLCDIGLPGMNGYEVVAHMRAARHEPRPALVALTGYGGSANADRALTAGFDHHIVKPVDPEAILRLVDAAMRVEDWTTSGYGVITSHGSLQEDQRRDRSS